MSRFFAVPLLIGAFLAGAAPAEAALFSSPSPELIYSGAAPGLEAGVVVIRDDAAFDQAIGPLTPAFGGARPDVKKFTVLRIVGRGRENRCRDTALLEVSTKGMSATARIEERIADPKCSCAAEARPPKVFLVTVSHWVRSAQIRTTEVKVPCKTAPEKPKAPAPVAGAPVSVFEGSWDGPAGVKVITDAAAYHDVCAKLGLADRGPIVDFSKDRVVVLTGRPRENGCRRTKVVDAHLVGSEEVLFDVEEIYAEKGQMCAQVFMLPEVFLYRVPASVMTARVVTKEVR